MKYSGPLKRLSLLSASMLVSSWGAFNVVLPTISIEYPEISKPFLETAATITPLFIMIAVLLSRKIAWNLGIKQAVISGLALVGISGFPALLFDGFPMLLLSRAMLGFGIGMFQNLLVHVNKHFYVGNQRTQMFGMQSAFEGLGGIAVTFLTGQMIKICWKAVFLVYGIAFISILLYWRFVPPITIDILKVPDDQGTISVKEQPMKSLHIIGIILHVFMVTSIFSLTSIRVTGLIIEHGYGTATDGATVLQMVGIGTILAGFALGKVMKVEVTEAKLLPTVYLLMAVSLLIVGISRHVFLTCIGYFTLRLYLSYNHSLHA